MLAYVNAKKKIIQYIKESKLMPGDKLPTEVELTELLDIGRLTLREAMNALKNEGLIHSVQGKGTFVACDYDHIADSLNVNYSVTEMIETSGSKAGVSYFEKEIVKADSDMSKYLNITQGTDVVMCARIRTADGVPVVYSKDYLSPILVPKFLGVVDENVSLYSFIENECGINLGFCVTEIIPICADKEMAKLLNIEEGSPLLKLRATVNDVFGAPLIYAIEYFRPDKFKFVVTRGR